MAYQMFVVALAVLAAAAAFAVSARADSLWEVEHARAVARAGGPVSDQDAEFLERYGATSGTPNWRARYYGDRYYDDEDRVYRHRRLRWHR